MKDYMIVWGKDQVELMLGVRMCLSEGWQPLGGVAVTAVIGQYDGHERTVWEYNQAMVKLPEP